MPNWCDTQYTVRGNEKQLTQLYNALTFVYNNPDPDGGGFRFYRPFSWVLTHLGIDCKNVYCRCELIDEPTLEKDIHGKDQLEFSTQSAWADPYEAIGAIMEKLPELQFWCQAEEGGNSYYAVKGPDQSHYNVKWLLCGDSVWEYYGLDDKKELVKDVARFTETEFDGFDEIAKVIAKYNADNESSNSGHWLELNEFRIGGLCNES